MIGTHQFRFRPVGAGTSLAPYYIVHIPNEQAVVFGVATNRFCRCNCAGIDGVCPVSAVSAGNFRKSPEEWSGEWGYWEGCHATV